MANSFFPRLALICCILLLSACAPVTASSTNTPAPTQGNTATVPLASGSFDLPDALVGLDALASYRAVLTNTFAGSVNGLSSSWGKTYVLSVDRSRQVRLLLTGSPVSSALPSDGQLTGQADGLVYSHSAAGAPCTTVPLTADNVPQVLEPSQMLPPVGTSRLVSDSETLNGLAVAHYAFDESALGMAGKGTATGDYWLASQGGYVVRYTLKLQSDQGIFDSDMVGTETWDYELSYPDQTFDLSLPSICPVAR